MNQYEKLKKIGQGAYGTVMSAYSKEQINLVAIKRYSLSDEDEGIPFQVLREISILKQLKHINILTCHDVILTKKTANIVTELCDENLSNYLLSLSRPLNQDQIKSFMFQILSGLAYCHSKLIMHRDIKPQNILINIRNGDIKLADFGLAIQVGIPLKRYAIGRATLWYLSPEMLYNAQVYSTYIDMWSCGCVFAEMANSGKPLFRGSNVFDQVEKIYKLLGTPNRTWPEYFALSGIFPKRYPIFHPNKTLSQAVPRLDPQGVALLGRLLVCNPHKRITAEKALEHPYFN